MIAPSRRSEHLLTLTLVSAAGVALLAAGTTWVASEQERTAERVAHSNEVLTHVSSTRTWVAEIQNAYRGFALTGSEHFLRSPGDPVEGLHAEVATLKELTADNPEQQSRLRDLDAALQPFVATGQQIVAARRSDGLEAAQAIIGGETRSSQVTRLGEVLDALDGDERRLLASRGDAHRTRLYGFWWVLALLVAAVATTLHILYGLARRGQAEQKTFLESEQRFHILARSVVDYAIFLLDREGHVVSWSAGAEKITGYSAKAILGRHFAVFYPSEDVESGKPARELKTAAAQGRVEEEGWRLRADGTRYCSNVVITALRDEAGELTGFGKVTRDLTERKVAEKRLLDEVEERRAIEGRLRDLNDNLERLVSDRTAELTAANIGLTSAREETRALSLRLIAAQEDERRRLSRELHDGIGGALTLIRLQLASALRSDVKRAERIEECVRTLDGAVKQLRSVARNLRPAVLDDLGLADALQALLEQQAEAAGWTSEFKCDGIPSRLSTDVETMCYRICQEALSNAARHARARNIDVALQRDGGQVELVIADDGNGFDYASLQTPAAKQKHFGLVSMKERATLAGGTFDVRTVPGRGTRIRVCFPLPA